MRAPRALPGGRLDAQADNLIPIRTLRRARPRRSSRDVRRTETGPPSPIWAAISYGPRRVPGVRAIGGGPDSSKNGCADGALDRFPGGSTKLQPTQKAVVLGVVSDSEPDNLVIAQESDGPVSDGHPYRVDGLSAVYFLELETGMPGVVTKQSVRLLGSFLNFSGQLTVRRPEARRRARVHNCSGSRSVVRPAEWSARASAASLPRISCEASNWRVQCSSSRSSSSSQQPTRSCSSGGRVANFAIAASSVLVTGQSYGDPRRSAW